MSAMPADLLRSLTWDRSKELFQHATLTVETGIAVYFADPQSPWQRGTNENTNGLLRQYFPKGTDLARWSAGDLAAIQATLNSRARKILDWRSLRSSPVGRVGWARRHAAGCSLRSPSAGRVHPGRVRLRERLQRGVNSQGLTEITAVTNRSLLQGGSA